MRRVLFQWRGFEVYSYPALLFVGLVAGVTGGTYLAAERDQNPRAILAAMMILVAAALLGARLAFVSIHWGEYQSNLRRVFRRSEGGAAQYGGLAVAFLASFIVLPLLRIPVGAFWDAAIVTILVGKIFTRTGCFLNGCCCGRPTQSPISMNLPDVNGVWHRRIPTQLLEAGVAGLLLAGSVFAWDRVPFDGAIFCGVLLAYGMIRHRLEELRENNDDRGSRFNRGFSLTIAGFALLSFAIAAVGVSLPWLDTDVRAAAGQLPGLQASFVATVPLGILAIVSLLGFVGCTAFTGDEGNYEGDLPKTVINETNGKPDAPGNRVMVGYWRLQEVSPATPIPGGTAVDQRDLDPATKPNGRNPGIYKIATLPTLPNATLDAQRSPTSAQPGKLTLQAQGLLDFNVASGNHSMETWGGFVEVPGTNDLNLPQFTIEALLYPDWDFTVTGRWYCVAEHSSTGPGGQKRFGIGIYAGPESAAAGKLNTPYRWQVWIGIKPAAGPAVFTQIKPSAGATGAIPTCEKDKSNYLAVTFDGARVKLWSSYQGKFAAKDLVMDNLLAIDEAIAPGTFAPNSAPTNFLIGMGRELFAPFPAPSDPMYPFQGRMQEVAIYKEALGFDRIVSHIDAAFTEL